MLVKASVTNLWCRGCCCCWCRWRQGRVGWTLLVAINRLYAVMRISQLQLSFVTAVGY